jgi:hypothetical protein
MLDYYNIYRNDHKENLRIFGDLKALKEYSSYANDLNRAFGENSYNYFHRNLTEPKHFIGNKFINLFQKKENSKTKTKLFEEHFNLKQFEESLANMKLKDKILNEKIKFPFLERMKNSSNYLLKKELEKQKENKSLKTFFPEVPDVGRYNPQYNSINRHSYRAFFGNMPTNRFYTIEHEIKKEKNKDSIDSDNNKENVERLRRNIIIKNNLLNKQNQSKVNNHFSLKKLIENGQKQMNDKKVNTNDNSIKENKSEKIFNFKNKNNISIVTDNNSSNNSFINNAPNNEKSKNSRNNSFLDDKNSSFNKSVKSNYIRDNNHCLRFETYTPRKPLNKTIIYNTDIRTELPNYYTSKYIKNNINFNKNNNTPNYIEQAIIRDQNPPLGFYEPKYNLVFNNIDKNVYIYKKNLSYLARNKIKKIFCDYNVSKDYKTVPSLNNNEDENKIIDAYVNNNNKSKK